MTNNPNGKQAVSIAPYQQLSSVFGNQIHMGTLEPGVYNGSISISNGIDNTMLKISIAKGTTLVFHREVPNPEIALDNNNIIGKIVLDDIAEVTVSKQSLWFDAGNYNTATTLYVLAQWVYDITQSANKYVLFSLINQSQVAAIKAADGTTTHSLIVATILNHKYYTDLAAGAIWDPAMNSVALTNYHISYDYQSNRETFKRLYAKNSNFDINFDGEGGGVIVGSGYESSSDSIYYNGTSSNLIVPATPLTTYYDNWDVNKSITIADPTLYYQIDFLRYKKVESYKITITGVATSDGDILVGGVAVAVVTTDIASVIASKIETAFLSNVNWLVIASGDTITFIAKSDSDIADITFDDNSTGATATTETIDSNKNFIWESFLKLKPNPEIIDFGDYSTITQNQLLAYLDSQILPIRDDGVTLMVAIRPRDTIAIGNYLWPESCVEYKKLSLRQVAPTEYYSRFKVPVINSTDIIF